MNKSELSNCVDGFTYLMLTNLLSEGVKKYANDANILASTEANLNLYGRDCILWAVSEKLFRYRCKGEPVDLVKAASWLLLLWALDKKSGVVEDGSRSRKESGDELGSIGGGMAPPS